MKTLRYSIRRGSRAAIGAAAIAAVFTFAVSPAAQADEPLPTSWAEYDVSGITHIGSAVDSDMAVGPTTLLAELDSDNNIVDGSLPIPEQVIEFDVHGIPVRATVTLTQVGPLTGALELTDIRRKLKFNADINYDLQISNVQARVAWVWWPLAVGSNCHTTDPISINASTPDGEYFTILDGGRAVGDYTIGSFTGCAPLNFLDIPFFFPTFGSVPINSLVSGSDNTLDVQISDFRLVG